jgi:hypothetical protein
MQAANSKQRYFPPKPKLDRRTIPIILWNLFPVMGVVFSGWKPESVFICYALETVVVGIFNVFRMLAINYVSSPIDKQKSGLLCLGMVSFFLVHYYFIVFIQLFIFFKDGYIYDSVFQAIPAIVREGSYTFALGACVINNAYSFINGFIIPGTFTKRTMGWQMFEPYSRVFMQQAVVMTGGFIFTLTGNAYPVLIVFVAAKIFVDIVPTHIEIFGYHYFNYTEAPLNN